jgi:hypothetical protein
MQSCSQNHAQTAHRNPEILLRRENQALALRLLVERFSLALECRQAHGIFLCTTRAVRPNLFPTIQPRPVPLKKKSHAVERDDWILSCGQDGIHVSGLTNEMLLAGHVSFPIESGPPTDAALIDIVAQDGDGPLPSGVVQTNEAGIWEFHFNSSSVYNGNHQISFIATFEDGTSITNELLTVTVSNVVAFPNTLAQFYGHQMWLFLQLNVTEALSRLICLIPTVII